MFFDSFCIRPQILPFVFNLINLSKFNLFSVVVFFVFDFVSVFNFVLFFVFNFATKHYFIKVTDRFSLQSTNKSLVFISKRIASSEACFASYSCFAAKLRTRLD